VVLGFQVFQEMIVRMMGILKALVKLGVLKMVQMLHQKIPRRWMLCLSMAFVVALSTHGDKSSTTKAGLVESIDEDSGKEGTCWPREWLAADFPQARFLTVKYKVFSLILINSLCLAVLLTSTYMY
jgi:hypothetical protein